MTPSLNRTHFNYIITSIQIFTEPVFLLILRFNKILYKQAFPEIQLTMKKPIYLLLILLSFTKANAQRLSSAETRNLAQKFFTERLSVHQQDRTSSPFIINQQEIKQGEQSLMTAFNFSKGGFVIVSNYRSAFPVLAYGLNGEYGSEGQPDALKAWLRYYSRQISWAENNTTTDPAVEAAREKLSVEPSENRDPQQNRVVEPLLRTTWDQGNYYNALCPADPGGPGGHCWAGCVATAVGQLMFYHRWPNQGTGEYSYLHPVYGEQYANFGQTIYNWNGMETSLDGPNNHIALLLNHLGVSFDMDYGPDGSGMWNHSAANSMRNYFKYGPKTQYIFRDTTTMNWDSILIANLNDRKPLYYAGWESVGSESGHAFVCDGYAPDNFYHFNWGWSSSYDGYFLLTALSPGGNNFNFAQEVIKDIYPDTLTYNYPNYCEGPDTLTTIAGTFSDGSNMVNYLNNSDCFWIVQPNEPDFDSITSINLDFPLLDLEVNDRIRIYQGTDTTATLISEFSGTNSPPTLNIPSDRFLVRFTTDGTENAGGFLGSFKSVLPVYCYGTTTYTDSSGIFDDGSGNKKYINNSVCKWKINPENPQPLTITFESFNTEADFDLLRIFDLGTQQLVALLSGDTLPGPISIPSGKAYFIFMTNNQHTAPGWTIRWEPEGTTGTVLHKKLQGGIYPNPVNDQLWLNPGLVAGEATDAEIYSANGKLILKKEISSNDGFSPVVIDTKSLEKGFYLLRVISTEGAATFRFIKL